MWTNLLWKPKLQQKRQCYLNANVPTVSTSDSYSLRRNEVNTSLVQTLNRLKETRKLLLWLRSIEILTHSAPKIKKIIVQYEDDLSFNCKRNLPMDIPATTHLKTLSNLNNFLHLSAINRYQLETDIWPLHLYTSHVVLIWVYCLCKVQIELSKLTLWTMANILADRCNLQTMR